MAPVKPEVAYGIQPCMADHGESSVICDGHGHVVCKIQSAVWDKSATLEYPKDREYAEIIVRALNAAHAAKQNGAAA